MFCPLFGCCTHRFSGETLLSPTCIKLVTILGSKYHVKPSPCKTLCPHCFVQISYIWLSFRLFEDLIFHPGTLLVSTTCDPLPFLGLWYLKELCDPSSSEDLVFTVGLVYGVAKHFQFYSLLTAPNTFLGCDFGLYPMLNRAGPVWGLDEICVAASAGGALPSSAKSSQCPGSR